MLIDAYGCVPEPAQLRSRSADLTAYLNGCKLGRLLVTVRASGADAGGVNELDANAGLAAAARLDQRLSPLYRIRPGAPESNLYVMAGALTTDAFAGAAFEALGEREAARLDPYLHVLARLSLPAVVEMSGAARGEADRVLSLARRHPSVSFLMAAFDSPAARAEGHDAIRRALERQDARLFMDTAFAGPDDVARTVHAVGPARLLFSGGAPLGGAGVLRRSQALLDALRETLPEPQFAQIAGGTAADLFRLPGGR